MAHNEAVDAVTEKARGLGLHVIATAVMCAKGATTVELELARRILLEPLDAKLPPREAESVAGCFNRHMDAAIESCNDSAHDPTRAGRRARLAHDLDRADLVLMDRAELALLLDRGAPARPLALVDEREPCCFEAPRRAPNCPCAAELAAAGGADHHELGEFPIEDDEPACVGTAIAVEATATSGGILGLEFQEGVSFVTHSPSFDVAATGSSSAVFGQSDPNLND